MGEANLRGLDSLVIAAIGKWLRKLLNSKIVIKVAGISACFDAHKPPIFT